jgi:hypothetical protein
MNSRIEPKFRDVDDARGKLVSLTSGAGFRLLVKQALAPGEPLQINIGDGNLLVLSRYRLPVELGHSFGAEGIADGMGGWRPGDIAALSEEASVTDVSIVAVPVQIRTPAVPNSGKDRRRLVFGGIAAAAGSVLGILWGGIHVDHAIAAVPAFAKWTAEPRALAASKPQPTVQLSSSTASAPMSASRAVPVLPIARVNTVPLTRPVATPREIAKAAAPPPVTGTASAHRISIKASNISWVTACADGVAVFRKALNAGESAEIPFVQRASVHSGNAGAIELAIGNQSIGPMGKWGEVRTVRTTPAGYEFVATTPARNCSDTSAEN